MSRFKPGQSGNPAGRPVGARNKTTIAVEALFDGNAAALTQKAIDSALAGDGIALRLCLDRIAPPRKDRPVVFELPEVKTAADAAQVSGALLRAVAKGEITPTEASEVGRLLEAFVKTVETADLAERISQLEAGRSRETENN